MLVLYAQKVRACAVESGRYWDCCLDVMVFLRMWMGGGVGGTDMMEIYLLVWFGDPALLVLTAWYGRK